MKGNRIKLLVAGLLVLSLLAVPLVAACAKPAPAPAPAPPPAPAPAKVINWNVSVWGGPRVLTFPAMQWAEDMDRLTNGRWKIRVHHGEVLAPAKEGIDGIKAGMLEACLITPGYHPGKTPLMTVVGLPFLTPGPIVEHGQWQAAVTEYPAIASELDMWNAMPLFTAPLAPYNLMSKVPIKTVNDFKGLRIRIDPESGEPLGEYGAVITYVKGPEVYTAVERGMLDAVSWVWTYTFGSYRLYELCKYATIGMDIKGSSLWYLCSKNAWDALPDEFKELHRWWAAGADDRYAKENAVADAKWLPIFMDGGVQITKFPPEERAKLIVMAEAVWEKWVKDKEERGLPGREILDFAIAKRDEILAKAKK